MGRPVAITGVPISPDDDRHRRMVTYVILMALKVGCFVAAPFVPLGWAILLITVAVVVPMMAVTIANAKRTTRDDPERPGPLELPGGGAAG